MSLFDLYTDPDIPGVFTSVSDNSITTVEETNVRKVLIIAPSKFGDGKIRPYSKVEQLKSACGSENTFKYGLGQFYARSFINAGATVLFKTLKDPTSTYANQVIYNAPTGASEFFNAAYFDDITEKDTLTTPDTSVGADPVREATKADTVMSMLAKGTGDGYNDLFTIFKSAKDYELYEASDEGIIKFKFNFINGIVYEDGLEIKKKSPEILFSLMDINPSDKSLIIHRNTGQNLYVNEVFDDSNDYQTIKITHQNFKEELRRYPNIDALLAEKSKAFLFIEGTASASDVTLAPEDRVYYEVLITGDATNPFRIQRAIFTDTRTHTRLPLFEVAGQKYLLTIDDTNGLLSIRINPDSSTYSPVYVDTDADGGVAYVDGEEAFYTFKLRDDGTGNIGIVLDIFPFLRWKLYTYLMKYNIKLAGGKDTTVSYGFVNNDGSANVKAIAKETYKFIRDNKEIREVIYPKYTFNYCIDWTGDVDVKDIMFLLADRLKRTMHIVSCPSVRTNTSGLSDEYSKENDVICRTQNLIRSSYNTMLYSSQINKAHFDDETKLSHKLPACYYALLDHLYIDNDKSYGITEPVANIDKGIIRTRNLKLSHVLYSEDIEELRKLQINCIVVDGENNYFIDQRTAYKKNSKLSLGNVVKTLQYLQTIIPVKLKPYIQRKETDISITVNVLNELQEILKPYKLSVNSKDAIFRDVTIKPSFNDNTLTLLLRVSPVGTTEKIVVPIIVEG